MKIHIQLAVVIVVWLALCAITFVSPRCHSKFDLYRVCSMYYGSVIRYIYNTQSVVTCSNECTSDNECRSWKYDPGTNVCETNSRTEEVTSFPGSCGSRVFFGKMEKATCRDTWMEKPCSGDGNCDVPNSACVDNACRCSDGYAYMYKTDSCMSNCMEYGSTFKEEDYYIQYYNLYQFTGTLDDCLHVCVTEYPTCRMVEYEYPSLCVISSFTALTKPDGIIRSENIPDYVQFLRNCY